MREHAISQIKITNEKVNEILLLDEWKQNKIKNSVTLIKSKDQKKEIIGNIEGEYNVKQAKLQ